MCHTQTFLQAALQSGVLWMPSYDARVKKIAISVELGIGRRVPPSFEQVDPDQEPITESGRSM
jgi:hypothetical protein